MAEMSVSNKEIADCFRHVRVAISSGDEVFICHAITALGPGAAQDKCKNIICSGIDGGSTFISWMITVYPDIIDQNNYTIAGIGFLARLAWLDKLIEEYSGEDDGR